MCECASPVCVQLCLCPCVCVCCACVSVCKFGLQKALAKCDYQRAKHQLLAKVNSLCVCECCVYASVFVFMSVCVRRLSKYIKQKQAASGKNRTNNFIKKCCLWALWGEVWLAADRLANTQ